MKSMLKSLRLASLALVLASPAWAGVVVIGNANLAKLNPTQVERIYTGRTIEVNGVAVQPVDAVQGSALRKRFLETYLQQDEAKYIGYWTVRRYIGKGVPPREIGSVAELLDYVQNTPGAIGYVDESELRPGVNVLLRK
ncbi:hypothetical protein DLREEDagrD3_08180 [Denitratisoma sp. agr-D3]